MKMTQPPQKNKLPLILAIMLHIVLFTFLFAHFHRSSEQPTTAQVSAVNIVQAVAVNSVPLKNQVEKLQATEAAQLNSMPPPAPAEEITPPKPSEVAPTQAEPAAEKPPLDDQKMLEQQSARAKEEVQAALAAKQRAEKQQAAQTIKAAKLKQQALEKKALEKQLADAQKKQREQQLQQEKQQMHDAFVAKQKAAQQKKIALATQQKAEQQKHLLANQKLAEQDLQQQLDADQQQLSAAQSRQLQGEINKYKGLILQAIGQKWIVPENVSDHLSCKLLIHLAPGGMVLNVKLIASSGDPALDRSATAAVYKASPLPVPTDSNEFSSFREFNLTVKPEKG